MASLIVSLGLTWLIVLLNNLHFMFSHVNNSEKNQFRVKTLNSKQKNDLSEIFSQARSNF